MSRRNGAKRPRVLAIASGGGHWVQLLRLRPAFAGAETVYATVHRDYAQDVPGERFYCFTDATRWSRVKLVRMAIEILWILLRERPDAIVTTGAAPGYVAARLGKLLRTPSVWIDSIANVEELSLSGQRAGNCVDLWLTQWEHLAARGGPQYAGSVL